MSTSFSYDQQHFPKERKRLIRYNAVFIGFMFFVPPVRDVIFSSGETNLPMYVIYCVFIALIGGGIIYWGIRRERKIFDSFAVIIDENTIIRKAHKLHDVVISRSEIRKIQFRKDGSVKIEGKTSFHTILVRPYLKEQEAFVFKLRAFVHV